MIPALALILLAAPPPLPERADDAAGTAHVLRGALTVFVFTGLDCPLSNRSIPTLNELAKKYDGKVRFYAVDAEVDVTAEQVAAHDRDFALGFITLLDPKQALAQALGAETTPTAVLVGAKGAVLYRGRIDDQVLELGKSRPKPKREDLKEALDEALAGKPISRSAHADGRLRHRRSPPMNLLLLAVLTAAPAPKGPTFHEDVQPILFAKCAVCHHAGEVAPFALLSYADAFKHAKEIAGATHNKYMPPWKPADAWGEFRDSRGLTAAEIDTLGNWYRAGAPEGDKSKEPPAPKFETGWRLGKPDLIVKMPEAFSIDAKGDDVYRAFVIPLNNDKDWDVAAAEFHPGNPKVDHHALLWLDANGKAREKDAADEGPGYKSFGGPGFIPSGGLGGWAPGATPHGWPDGVAYHVQKGSDLVIAMHYHPTGKPETDQSEVGLYFSKAPAKKRVSSMMLLQRDLHIPAGAEAFKATMDFTTPIDLELLGAAPHMHLLGQSMKVWATLPDQSEIKLIKIDDWDFNWQGSYLYEKPVKVPKGTVFHLEAVYDNSSNNASNPNDPPKEVSWGEQTTDEMCLAFLSYATSRPEDRKELFIALAKQQQLWRFRK